MKITRSILKILLVLFIIITISSNISYGISWTEIFGGGDDFIKEGKEQGSTIDTDSLRTETGSIYNILLALGIALAVIIGAILGIKFMTGGIEEQSKIKEQLIPYIIGCVIIFGAFGIWKIVVTLLAKI